MSARSSHSVHVRQVADLLTRVQGEAGKHFAGLGVIVADDSATLPITPLRTPGLNFRVGDPLQMLLKVSLIGMHVDGFHILAPDLTIQLIGQYLAAPISGPVGVSPERIKGARYMAALLGSALSGVLAAGVASADYGVVVFRGGEEAWTSE